MLYEIYPFSPNNSVGVKFAIWGKGGVAYFLYQNMLFMFW